MSASKGRHPRYVKPPVLDEGFGGFAQGANGEEPQPDLSWFVLEGVEELPDAEPERTIEGLLR